VIVGYENVLNVIRVVQEKGLLRAQPERRDVAVISGQPLKKIQAVSSKAVKTEARKGAARSRRKARRTGIFDY
jgi:hypothetical protein